MLFGDHCPRQQEARERGGRQAKINPEESRAAGWIEVEHSGAADISFKDSDQPCVF